MPDGFGVRELCSRFSSWRSVRHIPGVAAEENQGAGKHSPRRQEKRRQAAALQTHAALQPGPGRISPGRYDEDGRAIREPGLMPKPFPPRNKPPGRTPLPLEGSGAGPLEPPPVTSMGGAPKETGADGSAPMYCE